MQTEERPNDLTLTTAKIVTLACSIAPIPYAVLRVDPHPFVGLMMRAGPLLAVVFWLQKDARRTGVGAVLDLGYFALTAWPIVIPWYAFTTRGERGWKLTAGLLALIAAPHLTWMLAVGFASYFGPDL